MKPIYVAIAALLLTACNIGKPTAMDVCEKLVAAGVAENCKVGKTGLLSAAAAERVDFDLPSVPGEKGQALRFNKKSDLEVTVEAFDRAAVLVGPHRYGSPSALILVQLNSGASPAVGAKTKAVVDGL